MTVIRNGKKSERFELLIILAFVLFTALCIFARLGSVLNLCFPLFSLFIGFFFYSRHQVFYLGFSWWLFFLTPLVRRLADVQSGFTNPSPILLAPFLVCALACLTVLKKLPHTTKGDSSLFTISFLGVLYGCAVGLIQAPLTNWIIGAIDAIVPVAYGFHIYVNWQYYPLYKESIVRAFSWGIMLMGVYGIYQYLVAPSWDRYWLTNIFGESAQTLNLLGTPFGTPQPFGIRVWSTMNGPLDFAMVMGTGLLLIVCHKSSLAIFSSVLGYLAFLLSLARTAWLAWFISLASLLLRSNFKTQFRLILIAFFISVLVIPVVSQEPFYSVIQARIETFTNIANDGSGAERQETYRILLNSISTNVLGYGIGADLGLDRPLDSSILYMLAHFGWIGTISYFGGMLLLLYSSYQNTNKVRDSFFLASRSIALGSIAVFPLGPVILGVTGVMIWTLIGISLAGKKYYLNHCLAHPFVEEDDHDSSPYRS